VSTTSLPKDTSPARLRLEQQMGRKLNESNHQRVY